MLSQTLKFEENNVSLVLLFVAQELRYGHCLIFQLTSEIATKGKNKECGRRVDFDSRVYFLVIFYCTIVQNLHGMWKILKRITWEILAHPSMQESA